MIVAVVVTYDAPPGALRACVEGLVGEVDRVIIVDTGRRADAGELPDAERIELVPVANDGYGAAANTGFERAAELGATAVVLLNDDVVGRPGWVAPLVAALEPDDIGAAQPVLLHAGGGSALVQSSGVRVGDDGAGTDVDDGAEFRPSSDVDEIELFTAGAVAFAPDFLAATGGFDRRWFLYYEDVDLGRRGAQLGWRYVVVHGSVVEHERGASTGQDAARTHFLRERNRLWAAFRHAPAATIGRALWLSLRRLRHPPHAVHARALAAGLAGAPRELWYRARRRSVAG